MFLHANYKWFERIFRYMLVILIWHSTNILASKTKYSRKCYYFTKYFLSTLLFAFSNFRIYKFITCVDLMLVWKIFFVPVWALIFHCSMFTIWFFEPNLFHCYIVTRSKLKYTHTIEWNCSLQSNKFLPTLCVLCSVLTFQCKNKYLNLSYRKEDCDH